MLTGRFGYTVSMIALDVIVFPVEQSAFEVSTQVMVSPFAGGYIKVALFGMVIIIPFTFQWYVGFKPPFTGKAVNVTGVPAQTGVDGFAVMETPIGIP